MPIVILVVFLCCSLASFLGTRRVVNLAFSGLVLAWLEQFFAADIFLLIKKIVSLGVHQASSMPNNIENVEDQKMSCTQGHLDYNWIYSLKILAHFRSKVLVDFHHFVTQINCLTGAIISETYIRHILRMNIFNDYKILHKKLICGSLMFGPLMLRPVDLWREHQWTMVFY